VGASGGGLEPDRFAAGGAGSLAEDEEAAGLVEARIAEVRSELDLIESAALTDDATLDLTLEELAVLASRADREPPAPVRAEVAVAASRPGWAASLDTALRGLRARHLVDSDGRPAEPVLRLLELFDEPVLVGHVELELEVGTLDFHLCADEEVAGEAVALASGLYRLSVFPVREFVSRLVVRSGLIVRPHTPGTIALPFDALAHLVAAVADGGDPVELLGAHADVTIASRFVSASRERVSAALVTVLTSPEAGVLEGGTLSWLDGGPHGLWRLPDQDDPDHGSNGLAEIRAIEAEDLLGEIASYLGLDGSAR